jgi:hypothetical protein
MTTTTITIINLPLLPPSFAMATLSPTVFPPPYTPRFIVHYPPIPPPPPPPPPSPGERRVGVINPPSLKGGCS